MKGDRTRGSPVLPVSLRERPAAPVRKLRPSGENYSSQKAARGGADRAHSSWFAARHHGSCSSARGPGRATASANMRGAAGSPRARGC